MNDEQKQSILLFAALFFTIMVIVHPFIVPSQQQATETPAETEQLQSIGATSATGETVPATTAETASDEGAIASPVRFSGTLEAPKALVHIARTAADPLNSYTVSFTSHGAALREYALTGYYRTAEKEENDPLLLAAPMHETRRGLRIDAINQRSIAALPYEIESIPVGATVEGVPTPPTSEENTLVFRTAVDGWSIRKVYDFAAHEGLGFACTLEFTNAMQQPRILQYSFAGPAGIVPDDTTFFGQIQAMSAYLADPESVTATVSHQDVLTLAGQEKPVQHGEKNLLWAGSKNRFFASILLADQPGAVLQTELHPIAVSPMYLEAHPKWQPFYAVDNKRKTFDGIYNVSVLQDMIRQTPFLAILFEQRELKVEELSREQILRILETSGQFAPGKLLGYINTEPMLHVQTPQPVAPGMTVRHRYHYYGGPAEETMLHAFDPRLNGVVDYAWGGMDFLSVWLVWLLVQLSILTGNYGLAMILVTILIKTVLHPLTRKALASGHKMQQVAPKMKELQKKYENDRAKLNQEMMRLYSEEGVNPLGGCLPMLIQLPLFIALYGAFARGFVGRHATFIPGWLDDLSMPDRVYDLGFTLPLLGSHYLNLLPILYLGLQLIHMSMQPKSDDPQVQQQQQMMKFMPIVFVFIFYRMPSGLVLYFTVSTLYTLVEHWLIKRNMPEPGKGGGTGGTPAIATANETAAIPVAAGTGVGKKKKKK